MSTFADLFMRSLGHRQGEGGRQQQEELSRHAARSGTPPPGRSEGVRDGAGDTSTNDSTPAVSGAAASDKNRMMAGAIKALFRIAAKVLTNDEDEPQPGARRRRGETEGDLLKPIVLRPDLAGRPASRGRYAALQPKAFPEAGLMASSRAFVSADVAAPAYLSDTLDCMNPYWPPDADAGNEIDNDFVSKQDGYFPQP